MNRIQALLRYDYMMERKRLFWWLLGATGFIIAMGIFCMMSESFLSDALPTRVALRMEWWMQAAIFLTPIVLMHSVQDKYTMPRSSVSYITLPGSTAEKMAAMVIEFITVPVVLYVLYIVAFYIVMGISAWQLPEYDWTINIFHITDFEEQMQAATTTIQMNDVTNTAIDLIEDTLVSNKICLAITNWSLSILLLLIYTMLNIHFSGRSQVKTAVIIALSVFALAITLVTISVKFLTFADRENVQDFLAKWFDNFNIGVQTFVIVLPLLCCVALYAMYRQLQKRQAK